MATLTVGAGEMFSTLSAAIAASSDGDVIQVAAGTYTNDFATINTKITIEGVGGMVHMVATVPPPDDKAILTINVDATLYNMEFSGATSADGNGAGIRYDSGNLVLDHTYFHDNQDGLLAADDPTGSITITSSEFANNGTGDGLTHNLYVGQVGTLTVGNSYFHDVVVGHEIKSRALNTIIKNTRLADGPSGTGSYEVDLPNGGNATISGNVIEKGPNAQNGNFISFGEEGDVHSGSTLSVTGNTVLNDDSRASALVRDVSGGSVAITNNQVYALSASRFYAGAGSPNISGNTILNPEPSFDTSHPYLPVVSFAFAVCFAAGTRILGPSGEIAVERLRPGDDVMTLVGGHRVARPVRWVGYRRIDLSRHPRPRTVAPIRIVRGAIAENVPHRDLLLSPDHALFLHGMLIVARQLINGGTIRQDEGTGDVEYFHVELDTHGILLAEGLAAESYLDTGNRGFFANSPAPLHLHPDLTGDGSERRVSGSCAPFRADPAAVWPVWRALADRGSTLGYVNATGATTTDHELRLSVGDKSPLPACVDGGRHLFVLPDHCTSVRLLSRSAAPSGCRPWLEDRRRLGVSVERIVLRGDGSVHEVAVDDPALHDGWWAPEGVGNALTRWTDGDAVLPLPGMRAPAVLEIHLADQMTYWRDGAGNTAAVIDPDSSRVPRPLAPALGGGTRRARG